MDDRQIRIIERSFSVIGNSVAAAHTMQQVAIVPENKSKL